jgi:hypothetical protein
MIVHLMLVSENEAVLRLVGDFARGLGCAVDTVPALPGRAIRTEVPDAGDTLLEVLTHIALSATKGGVDVAEPLCRVTYRHGSAPSEVTLGLRIAEFSIDTAATVRV